MTERPTLFADRPEQEVRELFASSWIAQGFTDANEVQAWITAGTESARDAADAIEAGYRPDDPWLKRAGPQFKHRPRTIRRPRRLDAIRNRQRARRAWKNELARHKAISNEMVSAGHALDRRGGDALTVLGLIATSPDLTPEHVWSALAELDMQLAGPSDGTGDPVDYWESMIVLLDRSAEVCDPADRRRIRAHLLDLTAAIRTRKHA